MNKCSDGFCGMSMTDSDNCCFYCEAKNDCSRVCCDISNDRTESEVRECKGFIK